MHHSTSFHLFGSPLSYQFIRNSLKYIFSIIETHNRCFAAATRIIYNYVKRRNRGTSAWSIERNTPLSPPNSAIPLCTAVEQKHALPEIYIGLSITGYLGGSISLWTIHLAFTWITYHRNLQVQFE